MQKHKFNILMDMQWGSCGKGKFAPFLTDVHAVANLSCSHRPNAGHTVRIGDRTAVLKCLPSGLFLRDGTQRTGFLSAGASYDMGRYLVELGLVGDSTVFVHPRAIQIQPYHAESEKELGRIASTMQGAGAALAEKILRRNPMLDEKSADNWLDTVLAAVDKTMLHEAAQGWELSLDHGHVYPHVTSRNCGTAAALDEMGVNPRLLGDVYGVFRPYPIRVGNFEGQSSGDARAPELSWETILRTAGAPADEIEAHVQKYEYTTVTKRRRRVFDFSLGALARAVRTNGVSHLILNFAQYLDWSIQGQKGILSRKNLPERIRNFVYNVETVTKTPILYIGTGPEHTEVIELC